VAGGGRALPAPAGAEVEAAGVGAGVETRGVIGLEGARCGIASAPAPPSVRWLAGAGAAGGRGAAGTAEAVAGRVGAAPAGATGVEDIAGETAGA
jgi:hypothetical protein